MTALAPHVLYAVDVNGTLIDQIQEQSVNPGLQELIASGDGLVDATYAAAMSADPVITFRTTDIAAALDAAGISGRACSSDVYCYFQALAEGGTRQGASSHVKMTVIEGLLVPVSLSVEQDGVASIEMALFIWSADGTTSPVTIATGQSLSGTPSTSAKWTIGTCKCNNADIPAESAGIEFGIRVERMRADGLVYPTFGCIMDRRPVVTFATANVTALSTFGLVGAARASSTVLYLRKLAEGATRVADGTEQHISFTVNEGRISVRNVGGSHGEKLMAALQITPTYDGSNAVIVVDTTAAIS